MDCSSKLIVLCIEVPPILARRYEIEVLNLPNGTEKLVRLSEDEYKTVLEKYDEEWAHLTKPLQ